MNSVSHKQKYPSLETERMNLQILNLTHLEEVHNHFSDEQVTRFMDIEPCKDLKEAEEIIRFHMEDSGCRWGIFTKSTEEFIGTVGFHYLRKGNDELVAEVGFDLARAYWGQGFMHEAMKTVILFGFSQMELTKMDATVDPNNERSIHLMKKLHFIQEEELQDGLVYFFLNK
ncbi:GNAT family N-acetyltransferase [Bacillus sp. AK128]